MKIPVKSVVLKSVRDSRNFSIDTYAKLVKVTQDEIREWEEHNSEIDIEILQRMAKCAGRNWSVFLLDEPVETKPPITDNRKGLSSLKDLEPEVLQAIDDAFYIAETSAEIFPGHRVGLLPQSFNTPIQAAKKYRERSKVDIRKQSEFKNEYQALNTWITFASELGIYVSEMSFPVRRVRAFSISKQSRPVIALSTKEIPYARTFSLLHELYHVHLNKTGICDLHSEKDSQDIETQCNRFASEFLMPEKEFKKDLLDQKITRFEVTDEQVRFLSTKYRVSGLAIFTRMLAFDYVTQKQYDQRYAKYVQKSTAEKKDEESTVDKRQKKYFNYYKNAIKKSSRLLTTQVFDVLGEGRITADEAKVILNIKTTKSLFNLEEKLPTL